MPRLTRFSWSVLLLCLLWLSCGRIGFDTFDEACLDVTCSGHGTCVVTGDGSPLCSCDSGYHNEGSLTCVSDQGQPCNQDADCADENPCSDNTCGPTGFCELAYNTISCNDGLYCTINDQCDGAGLCTGVSRDCSALSGDCRVGVCSDTAGACEAQPSPDGTECGLRACMGLSWMRQTCQSGQCTGSELAEDCADENPCTDEDCDADRGCIIGYNTDPCDDGNPCTMSDHCSGDGKCAGLPLDADSDSYIARTCGGNDCDDGDAKIHPGVFEGPQGDILCSDGVDNDCDDLTDAEDTGCVACTVPADCDDGNVCNGQETCPAGLCIAGTPLNCDNGLYCNGTETCDTEQGCLPGTPPCPGTVCNTCQEATDTCLDPADTPCDDGLFCNMNETCQDGNCTGGAARDCSFLDDQCNRGACDEGADECRAQPINEGLGCNDGNSCTVGETCQSGVCTGVECMDPPNSWCDGITLVEHELPGDCVAGSCQYTEQRRDCLAGECLIDHCETYLVVGFNLDGNSNDLRFPNHPPYHNGTVIGASPVGVGVRGGAYEFQSEQARIEVDTYPQFGEAFTWLAWVRARLPAQQPSNRWPRIVAKSIYHQEEGCAIQLGALGSGMDGKFLVNFFGTDTNSYHCGGWEATLFDDQWHHLALTWSASDRRIRLYQDGQLEPDCNTPGGGFGVQPSTSPLNIGANFDGSVWQYGNLLIDEVYLFDRELTEEHIQLIMNTGLTSDNL